MSRTSVSRASCSVPGAASCTEKLPGDVCGAPAAGTRSRVAASSTRLALAATEVRGCGLPFASAAAGLGVVATRAADFGVAAWAKDAAVGRAAGTGTAAAGTRGRAPFGAGGPGGRDQ